VSILKDQPLEMFRAAADAEKIQKYLYGLQRERSLSGVLDKDPGSARADQQSFDTYALAYDESGNHANVITPYDRLVDSPEFRKQVR
jgi:hypothetical protein